MDLKTVIIEDSDPIIRTIELLLSNADTSTQVIGKATDLDEARSLFESHEIDLAILDIQLRGATIFELLEELKDKDQITFDIIFITAHSSFEYAVKAIEYACLDFITKPISQKALNKALYKVSERRSINSYEEERVKVLLQLIQNRLDKPKCMSIALPKGVIEVIDLNTITHIEADAGTSIIYLEKEDRLHSVKALSHYSKLLETHPDFMQISRDMLVNLYQIKRYNHRDKSLKLKNKKTILASHRYSKHLKQRLSNLSNPKLT